MKTGRKKAAGFAGLFLSLLLLLPPVPVRADGPVSAIGTPEDLAAFAESVRAGDAYAGRTVTLTADIDMTGRDFAPIGVWSAGDYSRVFQGVFDGGGHAVTGLAVTVAPESGAAGFFSGLYNAEVKNLTLEAVVAGSGVPFVGGLAGRTVNVSLSRVAARVYVTADAWPAPEEGVLACGGLAGLAEGRTVMDRCAVRGYVGAAGSFDGSVYAGGAIGLLRSDAADGLVTNCYSTAGIYVNDRGVCLGGFFGGALGGGGRTAVQNCYAAADMLIAGDDTAGGFAGAADGSVALRNVWYDADLAAGLPNGGSAQISGLAGAPTARMRSPDFPAVLGNAFALDSRGENGGYPILDFEAPGAPTPTQTTEPTSAPPIPTARPTAPPAVTSPPIVTPTPALFAPRTGDRTVIFLWMALLGLGGAALAWLTRHLRP